MGRLTTLLHSNSELVLKDEYLDSEEVLEEGQELSVWSINESDTNEFKILPNFNDNHVSYDYMEKVDMTWDIENTKSTEEYIEKFGEYYDYSFPFASESSNLELSRFLSKYFKEGYGVYIINDNLSRSELTYIIRFKIECDCINFVFEIMNFDSSMETKRIELSYPRED